MQNYVGICAQTFKKEISLNYI